MIDNNTSFGGASIPRAALVLCIGLLSGLAAHLLVEWFARSVDASVVPPRTGADLGVAIAVGAGPAMLGATRLPRNIWKGWVAVGLLIVPLLGCCIGSGSPRPGCTRDGMEVESCIGQNWSFMQGRFAYRRATGSIDPSLCRAFVAVASSYAVSPVNEDGAVRCPYNTPRFWRRTDCEEVGLPDRDQCYVCSGQANTFDTYTHVQAFNTNCTEATVTYGVNVPPAAIDGCQENEREEHCRNVIDEL